MYVYDFSKYLFLLNDFGENIEELFVFYAECHFYQHTDFEFTDKGVDVFKIVDHIMTYFLRVVHQNQESIYSDIGEVYGLFV